MSEDKSIEQIALDTLRQKAREICPSIPFDLISDIYEIERDHQYDEDRDEAVKRIKLLAVKQIKGEAE